MDIAVNYLAVLGAAVASFVIGWLWYGPLFGKQWMKMMGIKEPSEKEKKEKMGEMMPSMVIGLIAAAVTAAVLGGFIKMVGAAGAFEGAAVGAMIWIGFLATTTLNGVLWEKKPTSLYVLNNGHLLVNIIVVGAIMGAM